MLAAPGERLRILLAEDHAVVREGTREILERDEGIDVVGEADAGPRALEMATECAPDIVLLDLSLPGLNGIEVTRRLRERPGAPRVLILSAYDDSDYVIAATEAGAHGYLLKTAHAEEVIAAIYAVARGEVVLHPALALELARRATAREREPSILSDQELEILRLVARGLRNRDIALELSVSVRTVEAHLTSIFNKLGVASRTEAIVQGASRGWLTLDSGGSPERGPASRQARDD